MSNSGTNSLKGRTYLEIYGPERTATLLEKRRLAKLGTHSSGGRPKGTLQTRETREKIRAHFAGKTYEELHGVEKAQKLRKIHSQAKILRPDMNFRHTQPHTKETRQKIILSPVLHHRDFDHQNDFPENRKKISRKEHSRIHSQSGRRAIIFIQQAVKKEVVSEEFYDQLLSYVNQEDLTLQIGEKL